MELKGWVRTSLIDYPDHLASVLFVPGCNFRCPMCHNADLVLRPGQLPGLPEQQVWDFLARRKGLVDGVVVSGGEPLLQPDLALFLGRVRALGLPVKLDTNGSRPDVLAALLDAGLLDYVAMDVKAPPEKYPLLTGCPDVDVGDVERSVALLRNSGLPYELRTTIVPGLLSEEDVERIAGWVRGAACYVLQQFRPSSTLDPALERVAPYSPQRLQAMAGRAERWVERVMVRGI